MEGVYITGIILLGIIWMMIKGKCQDDFGESLIDKNTTKTNNHEK